LVDELLTDAQHHGRRFMSVFHRPRRGALVLALLLTVAAASTAFARQNGKKAPQRPAPSLSVAVPVAAPARYFTINQVLATRELHRTSETSVRLASTSATMTDASPAGRHLPPSNEPFGLSTFRAPEGLLWVKWRGIEQQLQAEAKDLALCRADSSSCSSEARRFLALVESAQARQGRSRIEMVNRAVNSAIRYTADFAQHGVVDRWTTPLATLATGRGDCEDYAIAKYEILRAAGVPASDLRLLLVRDRTVRQDHAVLAVRDSGRWLILDNRHLMLSEPTMLPQFTPLFALDHQGVSLFAAPYAARLAPDSEPAAISPIGPNVTQGSEAAPTAPYLL
jgi:predicted transglutaminase-like cysteine proteinase